MDRLTEVNNGIVVPKLTANCKSHQYHCEDCDCEVMDCGFLRDALNRFCDYENTGLTPEDVPSALEMSKIYVALQKLKEYERAEAEGRLIVLPCKVGDTVWYDTWERGIKNIGIHPHKIDRVDVSFISEVGEFLYTAIPLSQLGKTVFLTREAAEAALKEAQQG